MLLHVIWDWVHYEVRWLSLDSARISFLLFLEKSLWSHRDNESLGDREPFWPHSIEVKYIGPA